MGKCCRKCYYHYTRIDTNAITINAAMSAGGERRVRRVKKGIVKMHSLQEPGSGQIQSPRKWCTICNPCPKRYRNGLFIYRGHSMETEEQDCVEECKTQKRFHQTPMNAHPFLPHATVHSFVLPGQRSEQMETDCEQMET